MPRHTTNGAINKAATQACVDRYKNLPPLPDWKTLSRWLSELNANLGADSASGDFWLYCDGAGWPDAAWKLGTPHDWPHADHAEHVSGDPRRRKFDPTAAARRLLSEARAAGFR